MSVWARIPKARLAAWTPDGTLLVSVPASGQIVKLTPKPDAAPQQSTLLDGLDQPHGMAFAGSTLYVAESDQIDALRLRQRRGHQPSNRGRRASRRPQPRAARRLCARAEERRRRTRRCGLLLDRIDGQHLRTTDREANPPRATIMRIPPGGGPAQPFATGVRNGTGLADRSGRFGVDGGQQPRQRARIRTATSTPEYVNEHPPEALARAHAWPRIGLALLQSRRRSGQPAVHPRHVHQRRRDTDGLRRATARRAEPWRSLGAARTLVHHECAAAAVCKRSVGRQCTVHGTGSRRGRPRCRSSLGATALWVTSRPSSAGFRPRTARDGDDRWRR